MRTLVAVDTAARADRLVAIATAVGRALDTVVDPVHVDGSLGLAVDVVARSLRGDPADVLLEELALPDVRLGVVGRGRGHGAGGTGHVASALLERSSTPLLVVPDDARAPGDRDHLEVLLPLDGDPRTVSSVADTVDALRRAGADVTVVHVFDEQHPPAFVDHAAHEHEAWSREFLRRQGLQRCSVLTRRGIPWREVAGCVRDRAPDLLVLGWRRRVDPARAEVVRRLLDEGQTPVLLCPVDRAGATSDVTRPQVSSPGR